MGNEQQEPHEEPEQSFYPPWLEFAHNAQRTAENAWTVHEAAELPAWSNAVENAEPGTSALGKLFPDHEQMEAAAERVKDIGAMDAEGIGPHSPGLGQGEAPEISVGPEAPATPSAATAPAPEPAPAVTSPAPAEAAPPLEEPITDDMRQMVDDLRANGEIPPEPVSAVAEPQLATPSTPEMSEMVENIQRAQSEMATPANAASDVSEASEAATATSTASEGADAVEAGMSGMEMAGRAMGGLGVLGGGLELYQGISEIAEGNGKTGQGILDVTAGGLGVGAGGAALMGAACPPLAIAAAAAGMGALGNEKVKEWGIADWAESKLGIGDGEKGKDSLDFVGDSVSAADHWGHETFGDSALGTVGRYGVDGLAAVGSSAAALATDLGAGVVGAAEGVGHGLSSAAHWIGDLF